MRDEYIFDIPIYRCGKEQHEAQVEKKLEEQRVRVYDELGLPRPTEGETLRHLQVMEGWHRATLGGPWQFNQIIGWMRLFIEGYGVGGHLWQADGKRMNMRMPKKRMHLTTASNLLWVDIVRPTSSELIYEEIHRVLRSYASQGWMKLRHLDLSVFERTGPFIDWHELFESHIAKAK